MTDIVRRLRLKDGMEFPDPFLFREAADAIEALTKANAEMRADALRYRYLIEYCSYHYGMMVVEPSPAEWGIQWEFLQTKPGEQYETINSLIDADIERLDPEDRALLTPREGEKT